MKKKQFIYGVIHSVICIVFMHLTTLMSPYFALLLAIYVAFIMGFIELEFRFFQEKEKVSYMIGVLFSLILTNIYYIIT